MIKVSFATAFIFMFYHLFSSILKSIGYFLKNYMGRTCYFIVSSFNVSDGRSLSILRTTLQGFPTAKLCGGISLVTTLPAPITLPSPHPSPRNMKRYHRQTKYYCQYEWVRLFQNLHFLMMEIKWMCRCVESTIRPTNIIANCNLSTIHKVTIGVYISIF